MRHILLVLVVLWPAAPARAESLPPRCERDWWVPHDEVPTQLTEVPSSPTLFLPARIPWAYEAETETLAAAVTVEVRAATGAEVTGQLGWAPYDGLPFGLGGIVRWRPDAALVAGERYTLELIVAEAPQGWEPSGCRRREGFSRSMAFTVEPVPRPPPTLSLAFQIIRTWGTGIHHGPCDRMVPDASCGPGSAYCCAAQHHPMWSIQSTLRLEGPMPPPIYTTVRFRVEWPDGTERFEHVHQSSLGRELTFDLYEPFIELTAREAFCTTVSVHDLMNSGGGALASIRGCPGDGDILYGSEPGPLDRCDPAECAGLGTPSEPVEPGPEADEVEGAEVADAEWDRSAGGCAGGGSGWIGLVGCAIAVVRRGSRKVGK